MMRPPVGSGSRGSVGSRGGGGSRAGNRKSNSNSDKGTSGEKQSKGSGKRVKKKIKVPVAVWKKRILFNLEHNHNGMLSKWVKRLGYSWTKEPDQGEAMVLWVPVVEFSLELLAKMKPYQKVNQFPGSSEITRKDALARNLIGLQKKMPDHFKFFPKSWIVPDNAQELKNYGKYLQSNGKSKTFIVKPAGGARGEGISLARSVKQIPFDEGEKLLVQEYLSKPFLIDGYKFDLRLYVFVASYDPLRVYLYKDGLVRLSTEPYKAPTAGNIKKMYMHLTNYSVNKDSEKFDDNSGIGEGSKRTLEWFDQYLKDIGHDPDLLWRRMSDVILKVLLVALPANVHQLQVTQGTASQESSPCFCIYGFDLFLNRKLKPYIIEVNRSPSLSCGSPLDHEIKSGVFGSAMKLLNLRPSQKVRIEKETRRQAKERLYVTARGQGSKTPPKKLATGSGLSAIKSLKQAGGPPNNMDVAAVAEATLATAKEEKARGKYMRIYPPHPNTPGAEKEEVYRQIIEEAVLIFYRKNGSVVPTDIAQRYFRDPTTAYESTTESKSGDDPPPFK